MPTTIVVFILYSILLYSTLFYSILRARRKSRKNSVIGVITCFKSDYR
nr:MAG TPA: chitin synthase regulator [Caudoviricetes sp.]